MGEEVRSGSLTTRRALKALNRGTTGEMLHFRNVTLIGRVKNEWRVETRLELRDELGDC